MEKRQSLEQVVQGKLVNHVLLVVILILSLLSVQQSLLSCYEIMLTMQSPLQSTNT